MPRRPQFATTKSGITLKTGSLSSALHPSRPRRINPNRLKKNDFDPEKFKSELLREFSDIISGQKRKEALSATLRAKLDEAKIPASYYGGRIEGRDFKDEEEITAYVEKTMKDYGDFKQELANAGFQQVQPPQPAEVQQKTEEENLIAEIEKGTKQIVEQKNQTK